MNITFPSAFLRIASISIFFLIWELSSRFLEVDLLPGPENVFQKIIEELESNELIFHTFITLKRVFISFIIAMFVGSFFGIFMGRKEKLNTFLDDWLVLGLNVPGLVIIILSYVWFGLNEIAAILAVSLNKIPMAVSYTHLTLPTSHCV